MTQILKKDEVSEFAKLLSDWRSMAIVHAVYENDSLRFAQMERILDFSPTILSQKLAKLVSSGIISRHETAGVKEIVYSPAGSAKDVVHAYHILEAVSSRLTKARG